MALATCAGVPTLDADDRLLLPALAAHDVRAAPAVWDDPAEAWAAFDLVVVRSTWDYAERRDAFLAWAESLPEVLNPVSVLRWNTDKEGYLAELEAAGIPAVRTTFLAPGRLLDPPAAPFVVKPAVSAGGRDTARFGPEQLAAARALVARIHAGGRTAMVQPDLGDPDSLGELGLVYLEGRRSHAVRRRVPLPAAGEGPQLYLAEAVEPAVASPQEWALAEAVLRAVPVAEAPVYARVDLVRGGSGEPVLLELELCEPSLYLALGPGSAEAFAAAIARAAAASQRRRISAENGPTTRQ